MSSKKPIIGFAGMTHLGLNSAVGAAQKGFDVVCFDPNAHLIAELMQGRTTVTEPDLLALMEANEVRLKFTVKLEDLKACDIVYISLDVPTDDQAVSDLGPIRTMIDAVNAELREDALLVVLCQVPPGFTRSINRAPERLYYQVETLIFGRAMERTLYPERYIIGCADPESLDPRYKAYLDSYGCPLLPMGYESAELAKTAINLFLAASVSTANTLAEVCEKIGADWQEIIPAMRLDRRIGQYAYIAPGLGLSGGNIERDLRTVSNIGYDHGAKVGVTLSYIEHSHYRKQWSVRKFFEHYDPAAGPCNVAILGLAYKENTHSVKNSPAVELLESLPSTVNIRAYDPVVKTLNSRQSWHNAASAAEAIKDADIICVMTPWDEFKTLDWDAVIGSMRGRIVIDPYRLIDAKNIDKRFLHCVLGRSDQ